MDLVANDVHVGCADSVSATSTRASGCSIKCLLSKEDGLDFNVPPRMISTAQSMPTNYSIEFTLQTLGFG